MTKLLKIHKLLISLSILGATLPSLCLSADGYLSYERFIRLNNPNNKTDATNWFGLSVNTARTREKIDAHLDTDLRYFTSTQESNLNFSLSEAFVQYNENDTRWTVGRKVMDWTHHERYWQLGYMNGQQGFKLLGDKQEGLFGLHYEHKPKTGFRFSAMMSYFYLPTLNPEIDVREGKIVSSSEWKKLPPTKTRIQGLVVPIKYDVERPPVTDIVIQKSLGANVEYSWGTGKVQGYAIYKPENTIRSNAEAYYDLSEQAVKVKAKPVVNHHAMYGTSLHQKMGSVLVSTGMDVIDPNANLGKDFDIIDPVKLEESNKKFESDFFKIEPSYDRESYFYARSFLDRGIYNLSFNYIQLLSNNVRKSDDFFSDTVKFKRAVGTQINYWFSDKFNTMLDLKYDIDRKDNILRGEMAYRFNRFMSAGVGAELIKAPQDNSYWSPYRANDTVYTSFGYHF
ncbi:MAG: hypothetical protein KC493_13585 [Bacteriovoracaceae bacterium]|nr:hypothetical protein [Bacteriovoracaceae bacterium]